jgi:hypothetical protein
MSRDSGLGVVNWLDTGHQMSRGSIPGTVRILPPNRSHQTCSWAHTDSYTVGGGETFFPAVKRLGYETDHSNPYSA